MKLSELQIISYLHRVYMWRLALSEFWLSLLNAWELAGLDYLFIYVFINILKYYFIIILLPTADAGLQATVSWVFQYISWLFLLYEQHIFIHDKSSLCFLGLTDLSIHKQHKTQASSVSATDSYGEKSLPAFQLCFVPQQWCHVQTTYMQ